MSWLPVALAAYFILAIVNLLDKFLVDNIIKSSRAYAFAACFLGAVVVVVAPWFLVWPGWYLFSHNIVNGFIFAGALWSLYAALRQGEASRILVLVGGITPIITLILSLIFFQEQFSAREWLGISLMFLGVFVIAFLPVSRSYLSRVLSSLKLKQVMLPGGTLMAAISALAYAIYFISTKEAYAGQVFFSAFIWTRIGAALAVMLFLLRKADRAAIKKLFNSSNRGKSQFLLISNQTLGATGFILQNYAVYLGSVVIVNALQGIQYAFLLVISAFLSVLAPKLLREVFSWRILIQKAVAVSAIIAGLYFIAV